LLLKLLLAYVEFLEKKLPLLGLCGLLRSPAIERIEL
uniref:Uncharacterized protein n=1 Tax=Amphimedon queenslandica TaxID=400682 RepID=A0A1X7UVV0_AMPQE